MVFEIKNKKNIYFVIQRTTETKQQKINRSNLRLTTDNNLLLVFIFYVFIHKTGEIIRFIPKSMKFNSTIFILMFFFFRLLLILILLSNQNAN